ncbi:PKD-like family lipoprotein [Solitalea longa]|nr:PKD-like family lipoprotein [Solitalea longa]
MKKVLGIFLGTVISAAAFTGCYKDLGAYDYKDINSLNITTDMSEADPAVFVTPDSIIVKPSDVLTVKLKVDQSLGNAENFDYQWLVTQYAQAGSNPNQYVLGTSAVLSKKISLSPNLYNLIVRVTDKSTGVSFYKRFALNVTGKWGSEGWLVLQEFADGSDVSIIASRDGSTHGAIYENVYSITNLQKLPLGAYSINVVNHQDATKAQKISIFHPNGGVEVRSYDFMDSVKAENWYAQKPGLVHMESNGNFTSSGTGYEYVINNGQISARQVGLTTIGTQPFYFNPPFVGSFTLSPFVISSYSSDNYVTLYDKVHRCFLLMTLNDGKVRRTSLVTEDDIPNKHFVDYSVTGDDANKTKAKAALDPATGSGYDMNNMKDNLIAADNAQVMTSSATPYWNCVFRNDANSNTYVVQFPRQYVGGYVNTATTGRYNLVDAVGKCPDINSATLFAVPTFLTVPGGKFYYASNNKIYTCSLKTPQNASTAVAQISYPEGTVIKAMKVFKSGYKPANLIASVPDGKVLVVATDETASGGGNNVYFYSLVSTGTTAGDINQKIDSYSGFGKITDIAFKKAIGQ